MFAPRDHAIDVFYYRLNENSSLYAQAQAIQNGANEFVKNAQAYADSKKADSWIYEVDPLAFACNDSGRDWAGYKVHSLRFTDEKVVPDDWTMTHFGHFKPGKNDYKELEAFASPVQCLVVDEGFAVHFHVFNDQILIATTPNKDGTRPQIAGVTPLEQGDVEVIKLEASEEELKGFSIDHSEWSPMRVAMARYKKDLPEDQEQALREAEHKRSKKHNFDSGYVPNPTTGVRGLLRRAFT